MTRGGGTVSLSLRLVREDETTIIGEDAEGDRRIFCKSDLRSCIVSRRFESVSIVVEKVKLRQAKVQKADISPTCEKGIKKKKRKCLTCRHPFMAHPSTFVCPPCKKTSAWRTGSDYSLAR